MQHQLRRMGSLSASRPGSRHRAWGAPSILDVAVPWSPAPSPRTPTLLAGKKQRAAERGAGCLGPAAPHAACVQVS